MAGKVVAFSAPEEKHTSDATCLLFYADHVFSGGADGKIKVYFASCYMDNIQLTFYFKDMEHIRAAGERNRCP